MRPLPTFETERLIVRQIEEGDAEGLYSAYGDPAAMRFWNFPAQQSVGDSLASIKWVRRRGTVQHGMWAIVQRRGGSFAGMINYHSREMRDRRLELGWIVVPAHWRQGMMTEAARPVIEFCFKRLKTHRIEALIEAENIASRALAARLGFVEEGLLRNRSYLQGEFRSVLMYALLQADWQRLTMASEQGHA